jgi:hypothetical protein
MALKDMFIGIWIVALWSIAHVVPAVWLAADTTGAKSVLLWIMIGGEVVLAAGLILGWRACRYLAMAQAIAHALVFSTVGWAFVFVAFAWGLHGNEVPILAGVGVYVLFIAWAFVYLFQPGVQDYFSKHGIARA